MTVIAIPRILQDKLTPEGADIFAQILDKVEERSQKATLQIAEERFEKRVAQVEATLETKIAHVEAALETKIAHVEAALETKIAQAEAKLETKIAHVETALETKIADTKGELRTEIAKTRAEIIKWMFIFMVGQFWAIIGTLFVFFKR